MIHYENNIRERGDDHDIFSFKKRVNIDMQVEKKYLERVLVDFFTSK